MRKAIAYLVRLLSASVAAVGLFMIAHGQMVIPRDVIIMDALASAGVLGIACVAGALRGRK